MHSTTAISLASFSVTLLSLILGGIFWMLRLQIATKSRVDAINGTIARHEILLHTNGQEHDRFVRKEAEVTTIQRIDRLLEINTTEHDQFMTAAHCHLWQRAQSELELARFTDIQRQLDTITTVLHEISTNNPSKGVIPV